MQCDPQKFTIKQLVDAWNNRSLSVNREYQRGASWGVNQQQALVDSVFRLYPIPRIFLHRIVSSGLAGDSIRFEIVDGQQRIRAFADFFADNFELLDPNDKRLRLPNSLRKVPAPWAGRKYSQLDTNQRRSIDSAEIDAFVITQANVDEVRDLFIRLQSGTALNRQQVRDAWPGAFGPFVENLAGKLRKEPSVGLFGLIDRRSDRGDDDDDNFTTNRQVCTQLFTLFQARTRDPLATQGITADDLDRTYHANTELDPDGGTAKQFRKCLELTTAVFSLASGGSELSGRAKRKFKKLDVFASFMLIQDLSADPLWKPSPDFLKELSSHIVNPPETQKSGKSTSGKAINEYYVQWRKGLPEKLGIRLDSQRLFNDEQRQTIHNRDGGRCQLCNVEIPFGEGEYDHFPTPHYLGGRTTTENGRLVCAKCHPRGRPATVPQLAESLN